MRIGRYMLDGEALLGRIIFRWHWKFALVCMVLVVGGGVISGTIPPLWRGQVSLTVQAEPQATILVDGRRWPFALYAGRHRVEAVLPDGRRSWTHVDLQRDEARHVMLPPGARPPRVRRLPPPAPGSVIKRIWWADGGWRVQSGPSEAHPSPSPRALTHGTKLPPVMLEQTVAFTNTGLEPLSTLDAYGGKADVLHHDGERLEAVFRADVKPLTAPSAQGRGGTLEVRGWDGGPTTLAISQTLTLVRWSPHGQTLLVSEQVTPEAEHLSMLQKNRQTLQPVATISGRIENVIWSPAGDAAVVISQREQRITLTLVRTEPTVASRVIAEVERPAQEVDLLQAMMPLTWSGDTVEWIAAAADGRPYLWRAQIAVLIPEQVRPLTAVAIHRDSDDSMQVVTVADGMLVLGRATPDGLIVEAEIPEIPVAPELIGQWSPQMGQILLHGPSNTWIIDLEKAAGPPVEGAS
jgi:hypothetical protein